MGLEMVRSKGGLCLLPMNASQKSIENGVRPRFLTIFATLYKG